MIKKITDFHSLIIKLHLTDKRLKCRIYNRLNRILSTFFFSPEYYKTKIYFFVVFTLQDSLSRSTILDKRLETNSQKTNSDRVSSIEFLKLMLNSERLMSQSCHLCCDLVLKKKLLMSTLRF